ERPYLLANCHESNCHASAHYHVRRTNGAGHWVIFLNAEGRWVHERCNPSNALPGFPTEDDAALFACMEGRFYHATVISPSSERIQIRVSPNFGQWVG